MTGNSKMLLVHSVRVAVLLSHNSERALATLLRLLHKRLSLLEINLLLTDASGCQFLEQMDFPGSPSFSLCSNSEIVRTAIAVLNRKNRHHRPDCILLPVSLQHKTVAMLVLHCDRGQVPDKNDLAVLQNILEEIYWLITNRNRLPGHKQFSFLAASLREMEQTRSRKELFNSIRRMLSPYGCVTCHLKLKSPFTNQPVHYSYCAPDWAELQSALDKQQRDVIAQVEEDRQTGPHCFKLPRSSPTPGSIQVLPLMFRRKNRGIVTLFQPRNRTEQNRLTPLQLEIFALLAARKITWLADHQKPAGHGDAVRKLRDLNRVYHVCQIINSTLKLNELCHLLLSSAVSEEGGGFSRSMLFMANNRSQTLQGMLGVTQSSASRLNRIPLKDRPEISREDLDRQHHDPFCQQIRRIHVSKKEDHPVSRAATDKQPVTISKEEARKFFDFEILGPLVFVPLQGREEIVGILATEEAGEEKEVPLSRVRFLQLIADRAGIAIENSLLLNRLEQTHNNLRQMQESLLQQEKLAALGEMATSIAHELKSPLVSIGGFARRLAGQPGLGKEAEEYTEIIIREVQRMEGLLSGTLAFSRKKPLRIESCNLKQIIDEAILLAIPETTALDIHIELHEQNPVVEGDCEKLVQVVVNLLTNAVEAMPVDGQLSVRVQPATLRGDQAILIEIEDSGGGVDDTILRNIFNPFFTTRKEGTGLGLSITYRLVELHHGDIRIQNSDKGAVFQVFLPIAYGEHH